MQINKKSLWVNSILGSIVEWYDFSLVASLSPVLAMLFFPNDDILIGLLKVFFIFGAGFLARPIGAILHGHIGDKRSRLLSLKISILTISISTLLIGFLPTFQTAGVIAPVLLVSLRLLQGLGAGGEHAGAITLMYEGVTHRKGFYSSLAVLGTMIGMFLGLLTSTVLYLVFSAEQIEAFAWRIPFIVGGVSGLLVFSHRLKYAGEGGIHKIIASPVKVLFKTKFSTLILAILIYFHSVVIFYSNYFFIPIFIPEALDMNRMTIENIRNINIGIFVIALLIFGRLVDYIGSIRLLKIAALLAICFTLPLYLLILSQSYELFFVAHLAFTLLNALYLAPIASMLSGIFNKKIRYSGVGLSINISSSIFGGSTPFIMSSLSLSFNIYYPVIYMLLAAIVSYISLIIISKKYHYSFKPIADLNSSSMPIIN